jgi:hypothetical protein
MSALQQAFEVLGEGVIPENVMNNLGAMYERGLGVEQDQKRAKRIEKWQP